MIQLFELFGASFLLVLTLMVALWVVYFFKRHAGIVDIGWAAGFVISAWAYFFIGQGYGPKKFLLTIMVTLWGGRLAWHLLQRYLRSSEEPRYEKLRASWGGDSSGALFLMMFLFQGLLVVLLSLPFLIVSYTAEPSWSLCELIGFLVWGCGVLGESVADLQLEAFKSDGQNKGKVCQTGLWYFSRHPNYFFEAVTWAGFTLFALHSPGGWLAIFPFALILFLLLRVSGIPLSEEQALKSKGEAYREYQQTTSPFIPWFRNK